MPNWNAGDEVTSAKLNKSLAGLAASAQATPDMTLKVNEGVVRFGKSEVRFSGGDSPSFTAPGSNNRIDLLVINSSGILEIIQGTAATSPSVPAYPSTKFVITEVYLRAGATSIKNIDDSTNGYIYKDARAYAVLLDKFGGDGSDGALSISSGTTTINLGDAAIVVKNYSSIAITGSGKLAFSNPHAGGTLVVLRSQGNVDITSSTVPCIDLKGIGATDSTTPNFFVGTVTVYGGVPTGGVIWDRASSYTPYTSGGVSLVTRTICLAPGAAGSTGGGGSAGAPGGTTGRGGGGMLIECGGAWNFTVTNGIDISGQDGGNGVSGNGYNGGLNSTGPGGGGGGNCGMFLALYNYLTTNTGTIKAAGGKGGDGGGAGGSWNFGAAGASGGGGAGSMEGAGGNGATGSGTTTPPNGSVGSGNGSGSGGGAGAGFNWGTSNFTGPSSGGAATSTSTKHSLITKNNYF